MDWLPTLDKVTYWHWWVLGVGLLILEILAPGVFFVWLALAALVLGLLLFLLPLPLTVQLVLFAVLSIVAVVVGKRYVTGVLDTGDTSLNQGADRFLGRELTVTSAIVNGVGRVRAGDSEWRATGPDAPAGTTVIVVGSDGATLKVVPQMPIEDLR